MSLGALPGLSRNFLQSGACELSPNSHEETRSLESNEIMNACEGGPGTEALPLGIWAHGVMAPVGAQ